MTSFPQCLRGGARHEAVAFVLNGNGYVGTGEDAGLGNTSDFWKYIP